MKAQSPDSRFRKTLNYSLAAFLIVMILSQTHRPDNEDPTRRSGPDGPGDQPRDHCLWLDSLLASS